jgi:hypothetical protein
MPLESAPAETLSKLSWIEGFVNDLLDPAGRDRRRRAISSLNSAKTDSLSSMVAPATKRQPGRTLEVPHDGVGVCDDPHAEERSC